MCHNDPQRMVRHTHTAAAPPAAPHAAHLIVVVPQRYALRQHLAEHPHGAHVQLGQQEGARVGVLVNGAARSKALKLDQVRVCTRWQQLQCQLRRTRGECSRSSATPKLVESQLAALKLPPLTQDMTAAASSMLMTEPEVVPAEHRAHSKRVHSARRNIPSSTISPALPHS
jgi:hypothetical protein